MVYTSLVQFIIFLLALQLTTVWAKTDRFIEEVSLGEKRLDSYAERFDPLIFQDIYKGQLIFKDEIFFQNYFSSYLFDEEHDVSLFLKSELSRAEMCTNDRLSSHFDEIRYSYRLISLSYLLEGLWHMDLISKHFKFKNGCSFDFDKWLDQCRPQSIQMKKMIGNLKEIRPKYDESFPREYGLSIWKEEYGSKNPKWYSQYRVKRKCGSSCSNTQVEESFKKTCEEDKVLLSQICSERDSLYGLSNHRDAYSLLGQSNIINTFNKSGEALGCLRRFSETMAHKEVAYLSLDQLFPSLQFFLKNKYQERFVQGRVFFYGSGSEFEAKGLKDLYVKAQPFKLETLKKIPEEVPTPAVNIVKNDEKKVQVTATNVTQLMKKSEVKEIKGQNKSAFLQAIEVMNQQRMDRVEVDMMKLRYDYVFSLSQMNSLTDRLKTFMLRDSLTEMQTFDKLGTKEGAVPLLFLKFMIDMQEHQGLWNLILVLGEKFYVEDDIDVDFKTTPQLIELINNETTGRQWQINILNP